METGKSNKEAPKSNTSNQQETEKKDTSSPIKKNPNPRANENLPAKDKNKADSGGTGSEITDGEDG